MGEKIAMGFHVCVDYELQWDTEIMESLIRSYDIHDAELKMKHDPDSERSAVIACLAYLKAGVGCEMVPETSEICENFANHFEYRITIGGTASRAAIAISKLGYSSALQACCYNEYIRDLLPDRIKLFSSIGTDHTAVYPHVVLQCAGGVHIQANDIDFVTPRENRVMLSRDIDSIEMYVSVDFAPMIRDAEVFLLSCFSEVLDRDILEDRLKSTRQLLETLPENALVVAEDGHYIKEELRHLVHQSLSSVVDILSMNEDELQEYIGRRIDILNAETVLKALEYTAEQSGFSTILVHSSKWAVSYGKLSGIMESALEGGINMAATRFRLGDEFGEEDYEETGRLTDSESGWDFCDQLRELAGDKICCLPCKDMGYVKVPTVVGLGDFFAGGLLPGLLIENR